MRMILNLSYEFNYNNFLSEVSNIVANSHYKI